ncbi:Hypothetical predicted protein [Cloeon dipterum]|uniref:Uncharacterized protein n=1 Tax=Cloeon dipterum TaxID=197152 RepID=A0A8S1D6I5_9INSE|nr:Hypothetical predicted protein [Cloeon dipterum]
MSGLRDLSIGPNFEGGRGHLMTKNCTSLDRSVEDMKIVMVPAFQLWLANMPRVIDLTALMSFCPRNHKYHFFKEALTEISKFVPQVEEPVVGRDTTDSVSESGKTGARRRFLLWPNGAHYTRHPIKRARTEIVSIDPISIGSYAARAKPRETDARFHLFTRVDFDFVREMTRLIKRAVASLPELAKIMYDLDVHNCGYSLLAKSLRDGRLTNEEIPDITEFFEGVQLQNIPENDTEQFVDDELISILDKYV